MSKLKQAAINHSDDAGAVVAAIVGLAGILNVPSRLGISAEDLAMAIGFSFTIVAFVRGRIEKKNRQTT
jgi:hypothetical protein